MAAENLPAEPQGLLGQISCGITWGLLTAGTAIALLYQLLAPKKEKDGPQRLILEAFEVTDTSALAKKLNLIMDSAEARDEKITDMDRKIEEVLRILRENEIRREERALAQLTQGRDHGG